MRIQRIRVLAFLVFLSILCLYTAAYASETTDKTYTLEELPAPDLPTPKNHSWAEEEPTIDYPLDGTLRVWLPRINHTIAIFPFEGEPLDGQCLNPAVFVVTSSSHNLFCSMATGAVLWDMQIPAERREWETTAPYVSVNGQYDCYVEGYPNRLVVDIGDARNGFCFLVDNHGQRTTPDYQMLEPLVWRGKEGVFRVSSFNPEDYVPGGDWTDDGATPTEYGPDFRQGLIDQDGKVLAECRYTDIRVLSPTKYALGFEGLYTILEIE